MNNGDYLVDLFDSYSANFPLMFVAFFEVISISWVYGMDRLVRSASRGSAHGLHFLIHLDLF